MTALAPAKLNLYLDVLSRREDGYHELDTVMQAVDLCDRLEFRLTGTGVQVHCSSADLPEGEGNIVYRAAQAVLAEVGAGRGVEIHLTKRIPVGGGLGGGSSDAAATILALSRLLSPTLTRPTMHRIASELGSDVPFFLEGGAARCRGRGERVEPIGGTASFEFIILWPGVGSSTEEVYRRFRFGLTRKNRGARFVAGAIESDDPGQLATGLYNRLEEIVCRIHPEFSGIKRRLEGFPFLGVGMSGSGSCLYGLIDPIRPGEELEAEIREATGLKVFRVKGIRGIRREPTEGKE